MAVTWADAKTKLRRSFLKDVAAKKWSDETLLDYANLAVDDLSGSVPLVKTHTWVANGRTSVFDLPGDLRQVRAVLLSDGTPVPNRWEKLTAKGQGLYLPETIDTVSEQSYMLDWPAEGQVTLTRVPTLNVSLCYGAYRPHLTGVVPNPLPPGYVAESLPIGRYAWMELAFYCYVTMLCHMREGVMASALEFFKVRQDANVGNTLNIEAREWWQRYQILVDRNAPK